MERRGDAVPWRVCQPPQTLGVDLDKAVELRFGENQRVAPGGHDINLVAVFLVFNVSFLQGLSLDEELYLSS
jgi:hypothetical protein